MALLTTLALSALVIPDDFKGLSYNKPKGWVESEEGGVKVLVPKELKKGEIFVILLTGAVPSNGKSWEKQFADSIAVANEGAKVLNPGKLEQQSGSKLSILTQGVELDDKSIGKHSRLYVQVSDETQRTFVTVLMNKESLVDTYGEAFGEFLASITFKVATKTPQAEPPAKSKIPFGDTPRMYPGMVGWRPSGRGLHIPTPGIVEGKPTGLWYELSSTEYASLETTICVFMPGGQYGIKPRLGGGTLYDYDGQRNAPGHNGAGTFLVNGGRMTRSYDGFVHTDSLTQEKGEAGPTLKLGQTKYRPLKQTSERALVGRWKSGSVVYVFNADGTFMRTSLLANGQDAIGQKDTGTYVLDGYLVHIKPAHGADWIDIVGIGDGSLIIGTTIYSRG
jgi:hypothetical protein